MPNQFRKASQKIAAAGGQKNQGHAPVISVPAAQAAPGDETDLLLAPAAVPATAKRVGVRLAKGWSKRNFFTEVLLPSLLSRRDDTPNAAPLFPPLVDGQIGITWIGHASFFVQMAGMNILVDPNWSLWLKGIKRLKTPGLLLHELPLIDLVLVTHAHFDHLDRRTLRAVAANQPIAVPFGVGNLVHDLGFERVHELDYWGTLQCGGGLSVTLTPCHHWGARLLHDQQRGFGGFVLTVGDRSVFHCGDTAFFEGFAEIGRRCPVEIALLPIGAYDTPSQREVHMNPEEAIRAFQDLRARTLVPMHFGTFRLSYEPLDEPPARLLARAREMGIADQICLMEEGRPRVF